MLDVLSQSEAVAVLCLLMVGADNEIKQEEISSMLGNPFFVEHVAEKIGPHKKFLKRFNQAKMQAGAGALEKKAVGVLRTAFPAFQIKVLALMTLIAGADGDYDQSEKELMARVSTEMGIKMEEIEPELEKMKEAILNQPMPDENETEQAVEPKENGEVVRNRESRQHPDES